MPTDSGCVGGKRGVIRLAWSPEGRESTERMTHPPATYRVRRAHLVALVCVLLAFFLLLRAVNLDADLPHRIFADFSSADELYYTIPAFNLLEHGTWDYQLVGEPNQRSGPLQPLLLNLATCGTLSLFGNTYYGLRLAGVVLSSGLLILLAVALRLVLFEKRDPRSPERNPTDTLWSDGLAVLLFALLLLYACLDFSLLIASRVAAPQLTQTLACAAITCVFAAWAPGLKRRPYTIAALLGAVSTLSMALVSIYNLFLILGVGLALLHLLLASSYPTGRRMITLACFASGALGALLTFDLYCRLAYGSSLTDAFGLMQEYSTRLTMAGTETPSLSSAARNCFYTVQDFLSTDIFRLNNIALLIFLAALPLTLFRAVRYSRPVDVVVSYLLIAALLQTFAEDSFTRKRLVVLFPLVVLTMAIGLKEMARQLPVLPKATGKIAACAAGAALIAFSAFKAMNFLRRDSDQILAALPGRETSLWATLNAWSLYAGALLLLLVLLCIALRKRSPVRIALLCLLLMLPIPSIPLLSRYVFPNAEFKQRDALISISRLAAGRVCVSGHSFLLRLYSDCTPAVSLYNYTRAPNGMEKHDRLLEQLIEEGYPLVLAERSDRPSVLSRSPAAERIFGKFTAFEISQGIQLHVYLSHPRKE
jgi:hypothetical protein